MTRRLRRKLDPGARLTKLDVDDHGAGAATYVGAHADERHPTPPPRARHAQVMQSDSNAWSFERYDDRRQPVTPPYEHFDYDIFKPLKER